MIQCKNLSAGYHQAKVISNIDMELSYGSVVAIIGPNGSGKSTLLRALLGMLKPMAGDVYFNQISIKNLSEREIAREVSFLTQSRDTPDIRAERLVLHGRFPWMGVPRRYTKRDVELARQAMEKTGCLELSDRRLRELSGGQRQAVYLAMVLAQDTKTILMDEPTTYLDIKNQFHLLQSARELAIQGKAVALVLHDLPQALEYADKILVLQEGRSVLFGTPAEVVDSGCIESVFGIQLHRYEDSERERFICTPL